MPDIKWVKLNPPERKRTYFFPGLVPPLEFANVTRVEVRESGKHRIETADGVKALVNTGWLYFLIDADAWTF